MCGILFGLLYRLLCTGTRGQNRIFFHEINFLFSHINKARGGRSENMTPLSANWSARISILTKVIIPVYIIIQLSSENIVSWQDNHCL